MLWPDLSPCTNQATSIRTDMLQTHCIQSPCSKHFHLCPQMLTRFTQTETAAGFRRLSQLQSLAAWFGQAPYTSAAADNHTSFGAVAYAAACSPSSHWSTCCLGTHARHSIYTVANAQATADKPGQTSNAQSSAETEQQPVGPATIGKCWHYQSLSISDDMAA